MAKTSKSGKKANKTIVSGGMMVVIVAIVLIIVCFFTYISGVLPQTLTGVGITETLSDGTTKTVKNFSVLETNFHFREVYDSYSQYGMVSEDHLDDIYDPSTGETYRDWLLREAASQMKLLALVERSAQQSGFMQYSKARELAAKNLDTMDLYAMMYGYPSGNKYLQSIYGTGMTRRLYIDFQARELLVQEYANYLRQFDPTIVPTDEQVQAKYNETPDKFYVYDYNSYYVPADKDDAGQVVDFDKCVAAANKIANAAKDSASFRQAVMDYLKEKGDDTALAEYEDGADPTFTEDLTYSLASYMSPDVRAFIFSDNKAGDVKTIETDFGVYVVYIADKHLPEDQVVSYRMFAISTGVTTESTPEEISAAVNQTIADAQTYCTQGMDPLSFYNVVKNNSTNSDVILNGGYTDAATQADFLPAEGEGTNTATKTAGEWLFDESRKQGDITMIVSDDSKSVYVYYFEASRTSYESAARNEIINANYEAWNSSLGDCNPEYSVNAGLCKYLIY